MMSRTLVEAGAVEGTFYAEAARWIAEVADRSAVVVDVGGGSGAAGCALARALPASYVVVAHGSRSALERARERSVASRVAERLETCECAPGDGVLEDEPADLVWAGDLVPDAADAPWSLKQAAQLVRPHGLLAWAEGGRATRVLDDDLGLDRPGLLRRLEAAA
ncbi:MAG: SAM-dependent methyltransferase, partial [Conexibacter sp.]|nr:SAM-dependent methyltransferase [Conexibacter sp.]